MPTEQQLAAIEDARRAQVASGEFDIERGETEAYRVLREELAPRLGLRPRDTPIQDRGGFISAEGLRQRGQLAQTAAQSAAQARLQYPLAANQLQSQQTQFQQNLGFAISQFQQNLNQQAFQNRLTLAGGLGGISAQAGQLGLGLATGIQPQSSAFANIANARNLGTVTSQTPGLGQIAGAAGGLFSGLGAVGVTFSSRKFKTDIEPLADEDILRNLVDNVPVYKWRYRGDETQHVGPMAEDFSEAFGLGDGKTINIIDAIGVLASAIRALEARS
jgi:hypothetical protein